MVVMVEAGHGLGGIQDISEWPWTWMRLAAYVKTIRNVYQRAEYTDDPETAIPPRWMFWDADALDEWFDERKSYKKKKQSEYADAHVGRKR